jgi:hypothetical protein
MPSEKVTLTDTIIEKMGSLVFTISEMDNDQVHAAGAFEVDFKTDAAARSRATPDYFATSISAYRSRIAERPSEKRFNESFVSYASTPSTNDLATTIQNNPDRDNASLQ